MPNDLIWVCGIKKEVIDIGIVNYTYAVNVISFTNYAESNSKNKTTKNIFILHRQINQQVRR